jgi:hypothetical protein
LQSPASLPHRHDPDANITNTVIANWTDGASPLTRALDHDLLAW